MVGWIADGSSGFTINENVVTYEDDQGVDNVFNCMWQDDDVGVSSGKHYWKIRFLTLEDGAGVGLTDKDKFREGYACKAIKYLGNLSDGSCLLVGNFGPSPSAGDVIGMLVSFEDDRLKVYIDVNGKSLGLAFDVPASSFKSVFPLVSFHKSGSATCEKVRDIPNLNERVSSSFGGIEGDWKLKNFREFSLLLEGRVPTTKLRQMEPNKFTWSVKVVNNINTQLSRENGIWKTSGAISTRMLGPPELMKVEHQIVKLIEEVKVLEIDGEGDLIIKSDTTSTIWSRYDSTPAPFVGNPFA